MRHSQSEKMEIIQYPGFVNKPFDVSDDGQKFLVNIRLENSDPGEIVVVQNWAEEFQSK